MLIQSMMLHMKSLNRIKIHAKRSDLLLHLKKPKWANLKEKQNKPSAGEGKPNQKQVSQKVKDFGEDLKLVQLLPVITTRRRGGLN